MESSHDDDTSSMNIENLSESGAASTADTPGDAVDNNVSCPEHLNFTFEDITLFEANPAYIAFQINGRELRMKLVDFFEKKKFWREYVNAVHCEPKLPSDDATWKALVGFVIGQARRVDQPPDASRDAYHREVINTIIAQLPTATTIDDLNAGRAVEKDGKRCFKTGAIAKRLTDRGMAIEPAEIAVHLRKLGAESCTERFPRADGGADDPKVVVRVWVIEIDADGALS